MSNQIKLTIDVSDELDKLLTVMAISQATPSPFRYANATYIGAGADKKPSEPKERPLLGLVGVKNKHDGFIFNNGERSEKREKKTKKMIKILDKISKRDTLLT